MTGSGILCRSAWERVQAAEFLSAALYRLQPQAEADASADSHVLWHMPMSNPPHEARQAAQVRQERYARIKQDLERLTKLQGADYAKLRDATAAALEAASESVDREVARLAKELPGGAPLTLRARLPDILTAREIAELWSADEAGQEALIDAIVAAVQPVGYCDENKIDSALEFRELRRLIGDLRQEVNTLKSQIDHLIYESACLRSRQQWLEEGLPRELRPRGAPPCPQRAPIKGTVSVAYSTTRQRTLPMIRRADFLKWLNSQSDWSAPSGSRIAQGWLHKSKAERRVPLTEFAKAVMEEDCRLFNLRGKRPTASEVLAALIEKEIIIGLTDDGVRYEYYAPHSKDPDRPRMAQVSGFPKRLSEGGRSGGQSPFPIGQGVRALFR